MNSLFYLPASYFAEQSIPYTSQEVIHNRVRVQIKVRAFSKKYCSPCVSTQLHLNIWFDSPRSEKKSVPFRIEKLNFLRKLWSLAFLAKKLVLISFFFYLLKLRILTVKKSKLFNGQKSSKKIFFSRFNPQSYIY